MNNIIILIIYLILHKNAFIKTLIILLWNFSKRKLKFLFTTNLILAKKIMLENIRVLRYRRLHRVWKRRREKHHRCTRTYTVWLRPSWSFSLRRMWRDILQSVHFAILYDTSRYFFFFLVSETLFTTIFENYAWIEKFQASKVLKVSINTKIIICRVLCLYI